MKKIADLPNVKIYEPVERCIYRNDSSSDLGREHIIPKALGGEVILLKSSCVACGKEIKKYEAHCLNYTFIQARTFLKLPMNDPSLRPEELRLGVFEATAGVLPDLTDNFKWKSIPVDDHPAAIVTRF